MESIENKVGNCKGLGFSQNVVGAVGGALAEG